MHGLDARTCERAKVRYTYPMTKLLEQGIQAVRELTAERQDMAEQLFSKERLRQFRSEERSLFFLLG